MPSLKIPAERRLSHSSLKLVPLAAAIIIHRRKLQEQAIKTFGKWRAYLARPEQLPPVGDWFVWLMMTGRGWGKTRSGAEWSAENARKYPGCRQALVAATYADARDTMIEGESGLLAILEPIELRGGSIDTAWNRSLGELFLANGSRFKIYTSEKPRQLRGPQQHFAWGDEPAHWNDASKGTAQDTTWSNLKFGTRLPPKPEWDLTNFRTRIVLTTTPKMVKLLRSNDVEQPGLTQDPLVVVTRGKTDENLPNLSVTYRVQVIDPLVGTRLGRQELEGELLEDVEGALWQYADISRCRVNVTPPLSKIVVSIDPAVTSKEDSDETGIITAGVGMCDCKTLETGPELHGFVLRDVSGKYTPSEWAHKVVDIFDEEEADRVIAEVNNGGDLVKANLKTVNTHLPYKEVRASRGKQTRAEPVAALYEQGKIHHLGIFKDLEDQMTTWVPSDAESPDRVDALVWALTELMLTGRRMSFS